MIRMKRSRRSGHSTSMNTTSAATRPVVASRESQGVSAAGIVHSWPERSACTTTGIGRDRGPGDRVFPSASPTAS
jgi:hypothetical protein